MNYDMLFSPMKIGNVEIKNRIVMAPMCMGFGQYNGCATETMMNYYEERAKGGVGLIFTEITRINDITGASSAMIIKYLRLKKWLTEYINIIAKSWLNFTIREGKILDL